MILELKIKNFILIKNHIVNFKNGLICITGETGAGKSIILSAINLLLGGKFDIKQIKNSEKNTEIEALFNIENNFLASNYLKDNDLLNEDDDENIVSIRRVINSSGKSINYINNIKCNNQDLRLFSSYLIEINSQSSQRKILNKNEQINLIDIYSENLTYRKELEILTKENIQLEKELNIQKEEKKKLENEKELLTFKFEELSKVKLKEDEFLKINNEYDKLSSASDNINVLNELIDILNDSIIKQMNFIDNKLVGLKIDSKNDLIEMLKESKINIKEMINQMNLEVSSIDIDETKLEKLNDRISKIISLSKKYNTKPENLFDYFKSVENKLNNMEGFDDNIKEIEIKIKTNYEKWKKVAQKISENRKNKSNSFSGEITNAIKELNMNSANFLINISSLDNPIINSYGIDNIDFLISTNIGQPLGNINLCSGGEISRISLAIQSIVSSKYNIPTQFFDEIDSGIGGNTGQNVGKFLKKISESSQVFSITHLAQVAGFADQHLFVKKIDEKDETYTTINEVTEIDRYKELSRMIGYENYNSNIEKEILQFIKN